MTIQRKTFVAILSALTMSGTSLGFFIDGKGSYGIRGTTLTKPAFSNEKGIYQAAEQYFRLGSEIRTSDKASFFLEFKLFGDARESHLGDSTQLNECPGDSNLGRKTDCDGVQQNSLEPRYSAYIPQVTKAYALYSTDYCLLKVGRRDRHWGMGIFLDAGQNTFDTDASIFDGFTCEINHQKSQTLGFSLGYDKISETGSSVVVSPATTSTNYGANSKSDDLDQIFFTIEYNDQRSSSNQGFSKQIGIYFANIFGGENTATDIKLADLYVNLAMSDLVIQNEVLFRLGESADPNLSLLGGVRTYTEGAGIQKVKNNVQSVAAAGSLEYYLSRSGSNLGPDVYKQGDASSHSLFLAYAYAPGDADGYLADNSASAVTERDQNVTAVAFHRNFKPGMILFNGTKASDSYRVDGVFDPYRVMNAMVLSMGYRYKSLRNGNFELKLLSANLDKAITEEAKALYTDANNRPVGYAGSDLGVELDLTYTKNLGKNLELGIAGAAAKGGYAWQTKDSAEPEVALLLQSHISFSF